MPATLTQFLGRGQALSHGFKRRPDSTIALEAEGGTDICETVFSQYADQVNCHGAWFVESPPAVLDKLGVVDSIMGTHSQQNLSDFRGKRAGIGYLWVGLLLEKAGLQMVDGVVIAKCGRPFPSAKYLISIDYNGFKTASEQLSVMVVRPVAAMRIDSVNVAHAPREVSQRCMS
ncbi:MAG TPA: hypothetical protein VEF34_01240 [Syntrophobacteraceae bacterium]|nr:hypothetical protein [Syntrophobacteraceae bacterium]